jgi:methylated-DNA-[protein]-cysteine S-methyltransferase
MFSRNSLSSFQEKVYKTLSLVPAGRVVTYKELAKACKCRSAQAVGGALKRNPFAPEVPCHRVIKADLSIGGFSGETTGKMITKKLHLLKKEGVVFNNNRLTNLCQLITAQELQ